MTDSADPGSLGIRIAQILSGVRNDLHASDYIVSRLTPGTPFTQRLEVSNSTNELMHVSIYPGAATNADGNFATSPQGVVNDLTSWTTVSPASVDLPAHSVAQEMVTITVPVGAPPSQQYGVIWAAISTTSPSSGITSVNRVGVRMYDPVGNYSAASVALTQKSAPTSQTSSGDLQWIVVILLAMGLLTFAYQHIPAVKEARKIRDAELKRSPKR